MPAQSTAEARILPRKRDLYRALYRLAAFETPADLAERLASLYHPDAAWRGSHPLDVLKQMDVNVLDRMRSHFQRAAWAG